jgi:hypothetical protein
MVDFTILTDEELLREEKKATSDIAALHNKQMAVKIL